jgi:hypothetical protein
MQVVLSRLEARDKIHIYDESNLTMNLVRYSKRRGYFLDQEEIEENERPPMKSIPEYQQKYQVSES